MCLSILGGFYLPVTVNGIEIGDAAIHAEMQHHPAPSWELAEYLPAGACERLFKIYLLNTLNNKNFREQTTAARQLNSNGIEPILLKGSASLFVKTFHGPGSRVMADSPGLGICFNKAYSLCQQETFTTML